MSLPLNVRVATRYIAGAYFEPNAVIYYGKWKNKKGRIVRIFTENGHPKVEIEPIPKGRKQNKVLNLFTIWRADEKAPSPPTVMARDLEGHEE